MALVRCQPNGNTRAEESFAMPATLPKSPDTAPRVIPEIQRKPVKAVLRKSESDELLEELGRCLDFARRFVGWTLDQLAGALGRDPRQVQRWIEGKERTQVDVVFGVKVLRAPFVLALASWDEPEIAIPVSMAVTVPRRA